MLHYSTSCSKHSHPSDAKLMASTHNTMNQPGDPAKGAPHSKKQASYSKKVQEAHLCGVCEIAAGVSGTLWSRREEWLGVCGSANTKMKELLIKHQVGLAFIGTHFFLDIPEEVRIICVGNSIVGD
jgi:hypothetical protein